MGKKKHPAPGEKSNGSTRASDPEVKHEVVEVLRARYAEGRLTCSEAFGIAGEMHVEPLDVGRAADILNVRITKCQLGLFGYGKPKKIIKPAEEVSVDVQEAVHRGIEHGRVSCAVLWSIAEELRLPKMTVSASCEAMKVKIGPCQLGAF